jgi:hypothetical protein
MILPQLFVHMFGGQTCHGTSNKSAQCRQNRKEKYTAQKQAQRIARRKQRG